MSADSLRRNAWQVALLGAVTLGASCGGERRTPVRSSESLGRRVFRRAWTDTAWVLELGADSGLRAVTSVAADRTQLYLVDQGTRRIAALDPATGARRWLVTLVGSAGDTITPYDVAPSRRGGVVVTDGNAGYVWHLPPSGRPASRIALSTGATATRVCELPDSSLLVTPQTRRGELHVFDRRGVLRATRPIPWPALRAADDLQLQMVFAPTVDGCLVGLGLGVGFARMTVDGFSATTPYVEPTELPGVDSVVTPTPAGRDIATELRSKEFAALDAVATSTRIAFSFVGQTADRNHVIDVYDANGVYRESFHTAHAIGGMAATDSALFVLTRRDGLPVVVAFRWPR